MKPVASISQIRCHHCGDRCTGSDIRLEDKVFCCDGCRRVYQILSVPELCSYYEIESHPGTKPVEQNRRDQFAYLDQPEIAGKLIQFTDGHQTHITLHLPQIHCSSCLWLLEHLSRLDPAIVSSSVNFSDKEVFITFDPKATSLRKIVELLTRIGYEPHLSYGEMTGKKQATPVSRVRWYKIGLAGFCFSNIMMLSLPDYLAGPEGVEPQITSVLNLLKIILAIPVIFYAANEFFIRAWNGLKERYLNIDAPIALALLITFGRSLYEIGGGTGSGYLDSMSGIVFFMLIGRWLQDRTYKTISFDRDFKSYFPIAVNVLRDGTRSPVSIEKVRINDLIAIHHGELVPMDAILSKGEASIDYSFVTGESAPVQIRKGEIIYAGGKQMGGWIELVVIKEAEQSYLTQLWNSDSTSGRLPRSHSFIDGLSRYFTYIVLGIALIAAGYWYSQGHPSLMWNALTTILIVACPCALLLSSNFTTGNILRVLSQNKFYLKNARVLEDFSSIDTIVFDKTGTLTYKNLMLVSYEGINLSPDIKQYLAQLLVHSNHPLSQAVLQWLQETPALSAQHFKILPGLGMEGWIDDHHIKIGSAEYAGVDDQKHNASQVCCSMDHQRIGTFTIKPAYRTGLHQLFQKLKRRYHVAMLSGDHDGERNILEKQMGNDSDILFNQKPEDKVDYIAQLQEQKDAKVLMIGDGLNDVPALHQSYIGIAVSDGDNAFAPAADGIIEASHIAHLDHILAFIRAGRKIILFSFGISILYNLAGLSFAVQGTLSPLIAAILMPLSTITIIGITFGSTSYIARRYHLNINHSPS